MVKIEFKWLIYAATLALGEGVGAYFSQGASAWAAVLMFAALVVLLGYGYRLRGWTYLALASLGLVLALHASLARENELRHSPWLRNRPRSEWSNEVSRHPTLVSLRANLSERVGLGLDSTRETILLNRAILLGERSNLPKATKQVFIESGTIHVFAISGLHVMIVARVLMFFVALILVPYRWQGAITLPFVWGYVLLIGAPPSAVRAALMAGFYFLAPLFERRPNGLISWALAFLLVHLVNPLQIADVGSQLSFVVMLALVLGGRCSRSVIPRRWEMYFLTAVAWAAGVPIAAMVFGRITPGGLVANLFLLVAAGYSVVAGAIGVLVSYVSETLAVHCNNLSAMFTDAMVAISNIVAHLPGSNFEIEAWKGWECVLWYLVLGFGLFLVNRARTRRNLI